MTLFASGDSITSAELALCCTRALRLDPTVRDSIPHFMLMVDKVRERAKEFDVRHFHIDFFHFPLFRSLAAWTLTTLHGRQDLADLKPFYSRFGEMPLVSISHDQRKSLPHANFVATIHHGIPADLHRPSFEQGRYLALLGRISPDRAIRTLFRPPSDSGRGDDGLPPCATAAPNCLVNLPPREGNKMIPRAAF